MRSAVDEPSRDDAGSCGLKRLVTSMITLPSSSGARAPTTSSTLLAGTASTTSSASLTASLLDLAACAFVILAASSA